MEKRCFQREMVDHLRRIVGSMQTKGLGLSGKFAPGVCQDSGTSQRSQMGSPAAENLLLQALKLQLPT